MTVFSLLRSKLRGKAKMTGTKFIPLIMLTYAVLPKPVQVRSIGYSNTCPADYLPSGKDANSCSIKIADTESLTTFLKQKTIWQDGYVQHARISIAIVGNVTDKTSPAPKDWIISYIDPSGPFYYVSWRSDFKVLSFGLLDDKPDQKVDIDIIETGNNNCTIQRSNKEITSQVVEYLTKEIRQANVTDNDQDYANIDLCFLTRFTWFIESPWYILKKYFGVPFQEFGYRCCNYFNGTVCCDDKLKEMEGYRIVPYIISVLIFCYIPLLFVRIGNLFTVFHPRHWYTADEQDPVADKKEYISMFGNVFFSEDSTKDGPAEAIKDGPADSTKDGSAESIKDGPEDSTKDVPADSTKDFPVDSTKDVPADSTKDVPADSTKNVPADSTTCTYATQIKSKLLTYLSELMVRKFRIVFILLLPTAIYIELCIYASAYEWKAHIQDVVADGMLFGFTSMLGDPLDTSFLSSLGGPLGALLIYHVLGVLLLILPKNFETDVIERGTCHCITGFICKMAPQGCNLEGYKRFERVLKTGIYLWFNKNFWINERENIKNAQRFARENTKNAEKFARDNSKKNGDSEIINETCLNVWCNYNNHFKNNKKETEIMQQKDSVTITIGKRVFLLIFLPFPLFLFYFVILNGWCRYIVYGSLMKADSKDINKAADSVTENTTKSDDQTNMIRKLLKIVLLVITFLMMVTFFYISSVIVSYSIYLFVYIIYFMCLALVTSPKQTSTYLMFVFMGIVFVIQMFKNTLKFYKDIFDETLQECLDHFKPYTLEDDNCVVYLKKDVARFVQKKIRPFYVEVGQMFFKTVMVILAYSAALIFLTNYSLAISDVLQNMTALITSALPTIIQSQLKPELPKKGVIKYMIKCYEKENKKIDPPRVSPAPVVNASVLT